jgi:predicted chitinase
MGSVEVILEKGFIGDAALQSQTYIAKYLSPFYGVTNVKFEGTDPRDFNSVQKSYGMWMIPPDVGTTVLVLFIDGDPNQGFWIGCVADQFQNHMVPGIASSQDVYMTPEEELKYGTKNLPVAEFHKRSIKEQFTPNSQRKPIHPFADRLLAQGLLLDTIRGVTSSSARRETPSMVFGISTPGPLDKSSNAPKATIGYDANKGSPVPISRLGGTQFVMDDGDDSGQNELVRIRTRTGHQILMHNSSDLIYIANSKGTAWIELTSNGKIDIYADDSISVHTQNDFNMYADRDINIEAGRNINVKANNAMDVNVTDHFYMLVDNDSKITFAKNLDYTVGTNLKLTVGNDYHTLVNGDIFQTSILTTNILSEKDMFIHSYTTMNVTATTLNETARDMSVNVRGTYNETVNTSNYRWTGNKFMFIGADTHNRHNGGTDYSNSGDPSRSGSDGATMAQAGTDAKVATLAAPAVPPSPIPLFTVPARSTDAGWSNGQFYSTASLVTIMQRVPMHEPWDQHENTAPEKYTKNLTDTGVASRPDVVSLSTGTASVNSQTIIPGTCSMEAAKAIGAKSAQPGIAALKAACAQYGLTTPYSVASLLGIAGGESAWVPKSEYYKYSESRLKVIFTRLSDAEAAKYANWSGSREEFFEFFYGGTGNGYRPAGFLGNTSPGDGGRYYGRGYIQLTGKGNYARYSKLAFGDDRLLSDPDLVNDITQGALVAVAYFKDRVKDDQNNATYINSALPAVGVNSADIKARKLDYYACFLAQLQGGK